MSITIQHTQECLCSAHIQALAGVAGVNLALGHCHDYGVDGQFDPVVIRGRRRITSGFPLQFQAKATTRWSMDEGHVVYDLEAKTFDDMVTRTDDECTLLLVLLCLPKEQGDWHATASHSTVLKNCCYWHVLRGEPCGGDTTKRIRIPEGQVLTPQSLLELMEAEKLRRMQSWR
ncbi:DUF4365 domain-containing protein [Rhizorhabdus dicambivorans]|uniref:DUF4365 domain-containing protein n=1 Tax=Rhizorhabdus dicambivorans TaxID=1850238 RepID=UPI000829D20B|nr:DUF4365 domain-containing protein [Rhizorhabdus dicambivorans]